MSNETHHSSCPFAAKQTGGEVFFIAIEPSEQIAGLPERCVLGLSLADPKSREQAAAVERFLNDNLAGVSITLW